LALFFQIAFGLGLPFSAQSGPFAFELLPFALFQIGFVFSNRALSNVLWGCHLTPARLV
jgi:hypothetical protein